MTENTEHVHGEMDISEHKSTYDGFMTLTKWSIGATIIVLVLMFFTLV